MLLFFVFSLVVGAPKSAKVTKALKSYQTTKLSTNTASNKQGHKGVWNRGLQCG